MNWQQRIVLDPGILAGKPIIDGTRLAVEFIIELLAQGWSEADILANYPGLAHEDVQACLAYASSVLRAEKVYSFSASSEFAVRLLADENFPRDAVSALREQGHDVFWVRSHAPGSADSVLLERVERSFNVTPRHLATNSCALTVVGMGCIVRHSQNFLTPTAARPKNFPACLSRRRHSLSAHDRHPGT